jgi:predicted acetyltransferase
MSELEYGFEKFGRAVLDLAASSENIKKRLSNATYHLGVVREKNIPEEMRLEFNRIYERITSGVPHNREGTLAATIDQITNEEAVEIAGDIVSFNDNLILWRGKNWGKYE